MGQLATAWLPTLIAGASFVLSYRAYRAARPKLKVKAFMATVVSAAQGLKGGIIVTVINEGGRPAPISDVSIRSTDGRVVEHRSVSTSGAQTPLDLAPDGGKASWMFDYATIRAQVERLVDPETIMLRGFVEVGSRTYTHRDVIPASGMSTKKTQPLLVRTRRWFAALGSVQVHPGGWVDASRVDLVAGTWQMPIRNAGKRPVRAAVVELIRARADGGAERPPGFTPVTIGWLLPGRTRYVTLPIDTPDPHDGATLNWLVSVPGHPGRSGSGAPGRDKFVALRNHFDQARESSTPNGAEAQDSPVLPVLGGPSPS